MPARPRSRRGQTLRSGHLLLRRFKHKMREVPAAHGDTRCDNQVSACTWVTGSSPGKETEPDWKCRGHPDPEISRARLFVPNYVCPRGQGTFVPAVQPRRQASVSLQVSPARARAHLTANRVAPTSLTIVWADLAVGSRPPCCPQTLSAGSTPRFSAGSTPRLPFRWHTWPRAFRQEQGRNGLPSDS